MPLKHIILLLYCFVSVFADLLPPDSYVTPKRSSCNQIWYRLAPVLSGVLQHGFGVVLINLRYSHYILITLPFSNAMRQWHGLPGLWNILSSEMRRFWHEYNY